MIVSSLIVWAAIGSTKAYEHTSVHIGCFKDTFDRALRNGPPGYGFDTDSCSAACADYQYFVLQSDGRFV